MRVLDVIVQDDFTLKIFTEDGKIGIFDVKPYFHFEVFEPLKDFEEFKKVFNGKYFIEWDCGADLSADSVEADLNLIDDISTNSKK
jgi:hypothetical protein